MDAFLEEIEAIMVSGTTEAGSGSPYPIFIGVMPDSTNAAISDRSVALIQNMGGADMGRVEVEEPGLQVLVRGAPNSDSATSYGDTASVAHTLKNVLHGFTGTPSTESGLDVRKHYVGIWNESGPFFIGYDDSMRPHFSNNFRVMRSRTT